MTREEAIEALTSKDVHNSDKMLEALDMAVKALEQEPCEDAISREEAIDACNQSINILEATDRIKDLPPVTPQKPCEERERGECPYYAG